VSLSLKQQIPNESAVKNALKYMGTNQRLTSYIACAMAAFTLADWLYGAFWSRFRSTSTKGQRLFCQRHCSWRRRGLEERAIR